MPSIPSRYQVLPIILNCSLIIGVVMMEPVKPFTTNHREESNIGFPHLEFTRIVFDDYTTWDFRSFKAFSAQIHQICEIQFFGVVDWICYRNYIFLNRQIQRVRTRWNHALIIKYTELIFSDSDSSFIL